MCKELLLKIKLKLLGKFLFLQVDGTTDKYGRAMTEIFAGPLDGQYLERPFLIHLLDIVTTNNVTMQQATVKALDRVFSRGSRL